MTLKELVMCNKNDMQWQLFSRSGKTDLLKQLVKNQDCEEHVEDVTGEALELFMPMDVESWGILAGENSYRIEVRLKNVED